MDSQICGIVGMMGAGIISEDHDIYEDLMRCSTLRGQDGTGHFQGYLGKYINNTYLIEKQNIEVNEFFNWVYSSRGNKLILKSLQDNIFIGHTRSATKGSLNQENCHPFKVDRIIGVHNGTLTDFKYQKKDVVDSLLLYEDISKRGLKTVLEDLEPSSAYALNFVNLDEKKVYFVRNEKRPLHFAMNKTRSVAYWASEEYMLEYILKRHKISYYDIEYFEPGKIYSLAIPSGTFSSSGKPDFEYEEFIPRVYSKSTKTYTPEDQKKYEEWWEKAYGVGWGNWDGDNTVSIPWDTQEPSNSSTDSLQTSDNEAKILDLFKNSPTGPTVSKEAKLNLNKIKKIEGKIPHFECLACGRDLNLVEQFHADKIELEGSTIYECRVCCLLRHSIAEMNTATTH